MLHKFIDVGAALLITLIFIGEYLGLDFGEASIAFLVVHMAFHAGVVVLLIYHAFNEDPHNHHKNEIWDEMEYDWEGY